jgi:hypothetical protein
VERTLDGSVREFGAGPARPTTAVARRLAVLAVLALVGACSLALAPDRVALAEGGAARDAGAGSAAARVRPPNTEDVEHMCALLTGCEKLPIPPQLVPRDFAQCVKRMAADLSSAKALETSLSLRECGLTASSCAQLRTCALRGTSPSACAERGKGGPVELCDGEGRAVTCLRGDVFAVRDCPRGGEQCSVVEGRAACTLGACLADQPPSCSASGTRVVECRGKRLLSVDCALLGQRCVDTASGPACAPATAACAHEGVLCRGNDAVVCKGGREVEIDCGAQGMTCGGAADRPTQGACTVPATSGEASCDPGSPPRCEGARVVYCAEGRPRSYLCRSLGLSRCVADLRGVHCV